MPRSKSLLRHGTALSLLTLLSRVTGLAREMTKAALLGTGGLSDAFSAAFIIPNLFRRLFAEGSIAVAFIPVFKSSLLDDEKSQNGANSACFLRCFFTFLSFFVSLAVGLGIIAAPFIVRSFGSAEFDETVFLTRLMFPFLAFVSIAALFQGVLNSINVFAPAGFAPILLNLAAIACAWALGNAAGNPARAMALGILIGGFLEAAVQLPFIYKNGFTIGFTSLKRAIRNENTRAVLKLVLPTIIGMAAYQLNDLVSSALARRAGEGVLSSLQYSLRLQELILGVFAVSMGTVLLPSLAEAVKKGDCASYNQNLAASINIISLITIPVTAFSLILGEDLIRLLFQIRNFDETSVQLTLKAFRFHIAGLFFIALNRILAPAFYARKDSKRPTAAGIVSLSVNIALAAFLVRKMAGGGIALALSVAGAVNTALLLILLCASSKTDRDYWKGTPFKTGAILAPAALYLLKTAVFSVIAAAPLVLGRRYLDNLSALTGAAGRAALLFRIAVSGIAFFAILLLLLALSGDKYLRLIAGKLHAR
ncbi:MAG: murein biosynthesis integral membrane protein MurJ [Spirochaetaceae bacterium]|jgi:putative peptidoglycan lipid II flippase|nr:murein biosynthesis integral membrane protein MurJ [Spirochaetaceae bacterium]